MRGDIFHLPLFRAIGDEIEHGLVDIDGVDFAIGDFFGDAEGEVAGAGSDIGDVVAGIQLEIGDYFIGRFFLFSFGAFEPLDGAVATDSASDFPAHVVFADAITCLWSGGVVRGGGVDCGLGCLGSAGGEGSGEADQGGGDVA